MSKKNGTTHSLYIKHNERNNVNIELSVCNPEKRAMIITERERETERDWPLSLLHNMDSNGCPINTIQYTKYKM